MSSQTAGPPASPQPTMLLYQAIKAPKEVGALHDSANLVPQELNRIHSASTCPRVCKASALPALNRIHRCRPCQAGATRTLNVMIHEGDQDCGNHGPGAPRIKCTTQTRELNALWCSGPTLVKPKHDRSETCGMSYCTLRNAKKIGGRY